MPDRLIWTSGGQSAAPCDVVEEDFGAWEAVWSRLDDVSTAPWRTARLPVEGSPLPPLTPAAIRKASTSIGITGIGIDNLGPWHFSWLSDILLWRICTFLQELERVGLWPENLLEALIHLIPKPAGGRRPIGVLTSLLRVWERARRPVVLDWRETCSRQYQWMMRGRGASRAVWAQTVLEESARQKGLVSAAVLVDLVKAFEQIILAGVWAAGLQHGFPAVVLRMGLELCTARRRLVYRRAFSARAVHTLSAILAGSGFASDFMYLMLLGPLDTLVKEYTALRIFVIADDIKLGIAGNQDVVVDVMKGATRRCIGLLEQGLSMEVSRNVDGKKGKTVAMGSTPLVRRKLRPKLGRMGIDTVLETKNLGVGFALGRLPSRMLQLGRWATAQRRAKRAARLGGRLGGAIITASAVPSVVDGASSTGMTDGLLASLRSMTAAARGKTKGRSISARLAMDGNDPGIKVVVQPIADWADAWWDELIDRADMIEAWMWAVKTVGLSARPNQAVAGGGRVHTSQLYVVSAPGHRPLTPSRRVMAPSFTSDRALCRHKRCRLTLVPSNGG